MADWDGVLVRFGEIGIKSPPVRRQMVEHLRSNLLGALERRAVEGDVVALGSRLWMVGPDPVKLASVASRTFGVVSASLARKVPATMASMSDAAIALALGRPWTSFAVRARREGTHGFSSQDVQVAVGSAVFVAAQAAGRHPKVDLSQPELAVDIDIRQDKAYVFSGTLAGPGGIPVGSQGRVVALLSDEASFLAAWMVMRRGCAAVGLHAGDAGSLPADAAAEMVRLGMDPDIELLPVCTGTTTKTTLLAAASAVARDRQATALVTGEGLTSLLVPGPIPVLRPICGLVASERERIRVAAALGPVDAPAPVLAAMSRETVDSLLSMRRTVNP